MNVTAKEIREKTELSQRAFAERYHIPLETLKGWESKEGSTRKRNCPQYVLYLLNRVVEMDCEEEKRTVWFSGSF